MTRWQRFGHDRLYATGADETKLGHLDLVTGQVTVAAPGRDEELVSAVRAWLSEHLEVTVAGASPEAPNPEPPGPDLPAPAPRIPAPRTEAVGPPPQPEHTPAPEASWSSLLGQPAPPAITPEAPHAHVDEPAPADPPATWHDVAEHRAGSAARAQAVALRQAAPVRTVVARLLGVHTDERAWRIGADGEEKVAAQLGKLLRKHPGWFVLHAVEVGTRGSDIDHVVIGPAGVFTLNTKHHPGAKIWVSPNAFLVNGHRQPYLRNSRHEAARAERLLAQACGFPVFVTPIIVPVGADDLTIKTPPDDVHVINRLRLVDWLLGRPTILPADQVEAIHTAARRSDTWTPPSPSP